MVAIVQDSLAWMNGFSPGPESCHQVKCEVPIRSSKVYEGVVVKSDPPVKHFSEKPKDTNGTDDYVPHMTNTHFLV
jgi:hypothetical protein